MRKIKTEAGKNRNKSKRNKSRRLQFFYFLTAVVCILFSAILTSGNTVDVANSSRYKYFTSIEIEAGSSLWDIAQEYMTEEYDSPEEYIEEVKQINHMSDDLVYEGSYLCIPYYSSELK